MKIYRLDGLYYTADKLASILKSKEAKLQDNQGQWYNAVELDNAELVEIAENGNRHECNVVLYPNKESDSIFQMFGFEANVQAVIETINVID